MVEYMEILMMLCLYASLSKMMYLVLKLGTRKCSVSIHLANSCTLASGTFFTNYKNSKKLRDATGSRLT